MTAQLFRQKIKEWRDATQAQLAGIARQTCMEMAQRTVLATPVDTGFLRGSWQPSINDPSGDGGDLDPSGAQTVARVATVANEVRPGDRFYMMNNASYARLVENGTSKMAGRFYVQGVVKQFEAVVDQVAAELGVGK